MEKKLRKVVDFAYKNSPFYNKLYNSIYNKEFSFVELPIIQKSDICEQLLNVITENSYADLVVDALEKYTTSGSTGICMDVYWSKIDNNNSLLGLWYLRKKYYNISTNDLVCTFYSNRKINGQEIKQMKVGNCLSFSKSNLDNSRIADIYIHIQQFKPKYIIIEPSIAVLLCDYIEMNNLNKIDSIQYMELTGEFLLKSVKLRIEKIFGCKTANQYGAYEVNSIAYECPEGNMHVMESNVYIEIIDENKNVVQDGIEGEICVTSLTNFTMPFIRYNIGDRGKICKGKCSCGNNSKIIKLTNGRNNDYIICENGEKIHCSVFSKVIERINEKMHNVILQYQIHQKSYNYFIFDLTISEQIDMQYLIDLFKKNFDEERLFEINIKFRFHDKLFPDDTSGKLCYFINEMDNINEKNYTKKN